MKYRSTTIEAESDNGASGTRTIPINIQDPISRITITYRYTAAATAMAMHSAECITKIELVDGSDVLASMSGVECQALNIYNRRVPTMTHGQYTIGNSVFNTFGLDFGRWLWDEVFAFNPQKFNNPQLKITWDEDAADASASVSYLAVYADVFDEKVVSPIGFLMSKEIYNYTCGAADSYEYIDLPLDYPIRTMLLRAYQSKYEPWYQIDHARLSEDNDKRVVFDHELEAYYRMSKGIWLPVEEQVVNYGADGTTYDVFGTPTDYYTTFVGAGIASAYHKLGGYTRGGYAYIEASATAMIVAVMRGYLPHHCFEFPFGNQSNPDDWYDVTSKGSVKLRLQANTGGTSGTGQVILQQKRLY